MGQKVGTKLCGLAVQIVIAKDTYPTVSYDYLLSPKPTTLESVKSRSTQVQTVA